MTKKDAWKILGIPPDSGKDAVKKRYAELAVIYHPEEEPEKFAAVYEAYKTILSGETSGGGDGTDKVFSHEESSGSPADVFADADRQKEEDEWGSSFVRLEKQYDEEQEKKRKKEEAEKLRRKRRKEQIEKQGEFIKRRPVISWFAAFLLSIAGCFLLFYAAQAIASMNQSLFDGCFHSMDILYAVLIISAGLISFAGHLGLLFLAKRHTWSDIPAFFAGCFARKKDKKRKRSKLVWIPRFLLLGILLTAVEDVLDYPDRHECGFGLKWEMGADGVLLVTGTGAMQNYEDRSDIPWNAISDRIQTVIFAEGVERVGNEAFRSCSSLKCVQFAESVKEIGEWAFASCRCLTDLWFLGDAPPTVEYAAFWNVTNVSLHHPADNQTWTGNVLTPQFWEADSSNEFVWRWIPFGPDGQDLEDEAVVYDSKNQKSLRELLMENGILMNR